MSKRTGKAPHGGVKGVAEMLKVMDPQTRDRILRDVGQKDPNLAQVLKNSLIGFEEVLQAEAQTLSRIFNLIPIGTWAISLRGCESTLLDNFFNKLPKRTVEQLREEMQMRGPQKKSEIAHAQGTICAIFERKMKK